MEIVTKNVSAWTDGVKFDGKWRKRVKNQLKLVNEKFKTVKSFKD